MNAIDYEKAMTRIAELMRLDPALHTPEGRELENLALDVEQYERERYPLSCCARAAGDTARRMLRLLTELDEFYALLPAVQWCSTAQPMLGGQRPIDLIQTEAGAAEVFACVARLRDGAYV